MQPNEPRKDELAGASDTFLGRTQPELLATPGGSTATDSADLERGSAVGRYVILGPLGKGGMGCVYAAYDPDLDRKVALKLVRPDYSAAAPEEARKRLMREAQAMARLNHPNVITVHDVGSAGQSVFVAMEMIKGGTLRTWLSDAKPNSRQTVAMFLLAGEGLAAAHRAGLVHRDFKPDNVLVGDDGRVCVTDFGLARTSAEQLLLTVPPGAVKIDSLKPLTLPGAVMGTPAFMAPEQLEGRPSDGRCDQFGFAVALYEALYGERPYAGSDLAALRQSMVEKKIRPVPAGSKVPVWMRKPLLRALEVDAANRFATMDELLHALRDDPKLKQRRWTYAVAGAVALIAGSVTVRAVVVHERQRCQAKGDLTGIWDDARRAQAKTVFLATGLPYAQQAFDQASANLDAFGSRWSKLSVQLCEAQRLSTAKTASAEEAACLQSRADELSALAEVFTKADVPIVEHAVLATSRLSEPGACAPAVKTAATTAQPAGDTTALRRDFTRALVLAGAGKSTDARALYQSVIDGAHKAGDLKLEGQARYRISSIVDEQGDSAGADASLFEAALDAEAAHDDITAARARIDRTNMLGFRLSRLEDAEHAHREAQAAMARLGDDREVQALMLARESGLFGLQGKHDEAIAAARKELEIVTQLKGADHFDTLGAEEDLGTVTIDSGQYAEAQARLKHALEGYSHLLGPLHPTTQVALNNLALAQFYAGDFEGARVHFALALAQAEQTHSSNDATLTLQLCNLGEVLQRLNRNAEAKPLYERAVKLLEQPGHRRDESDVAEALAGLARSYLAENAPGKAVPLLERSLETRRKRPGERANLANNELQLAQALWDSKEDRPRAKSLAQDALKVWSESGDADKNERERVAVWLAAHR